MDANDMRCDEVVELVTAYLDGSLDAQAERRIEANLARCEGCTRYVDQIRRTIGTLGQLPTEPLPDDARTILLNAFRHSAR